jgi:hypothetical protein
MFLFCAKSFSSLGVPPGDLRRSTMDIHLHLPGAFILQLATLILTGLVARRRRK